METEKPAANAQAEGSVIPTFDWLKWLGDHRDGFLVGIAVLYGLGYAVWSYNAWKNQLGQLPALEFQYIMAGIIPGIIIAIAGLAILFFNKLGDMLLVFFKAHTEMRKLRWVGSLILMSVFLPTMIIIMRKQAQGITITSDKFVLYALPLEAVLMYLVLLFYVAIRPSKELSKKYQQQMDLGVKANKYMVAILFCLYSLLLYINLSAHIPQELGGPRPRCAYVDLVRDDIAPSTLSVLVVKDYIEIPPVSQPKVVRSVKLSVYFSNSDYLLVRAASLVDTQDTNLERAPLYELRKEVIRAVQWCPS
jgi:hypothetical protein